MASWLKLPQPSFNFSYLLSSAMGRLAEWRAASFLKRQPHSLILARNARFKCGELDVVALLDGVLVFIEVRYRSNLDFGGALFSVDANKQRRWRLAALNYLNQHQDLNHLPMRFDLITFQSTNPWRLGTLTWYQQALPYK